jgi:hypothetical protein
MNTSPASAVTSDTTTIYRVSRFRDGFELFSTEARRTPKGYSVTIKGSMSWPWLRATFLLDEVTEDPREALVIFITKQTVRAKKSRDLLDEALNGLQWAMAKLTEG